MVTYVCAYDIADDRTRVQVARVLQDFGTRIQKSVFIVSLTAEDLSDLKRTIGDILSKADEFELVPVDLSPNRTWLRWQRPIGGRDPVVLFY